MTRPIQRRYTIFGAILLAAISSQLAFGQATVRYRLERVTVPNYVNDFSKQGVVVGHSGYFEGRRAFSTITRDYCLASQGKRGR